MKSFNPWKKIPLRWRKEIVSVSQTFIAVFGLSFFTQLSAGDLDWTSSTLVSFAVAAARSALKAAFNRLK